MNQLLNVITTLSEKGNTSDLCFIELFKEAGEIAVKIATEIVMPHTLKLRKPMQITRLVILKLTSDNKFTQRY